MDDVHCCEVHLLIVPSFVGDGYCIPFDEGLAVGAGKLDGNEGLVGHLCIPFDEGLAVDAGKLDSK